MSLIEENSSVILPIMFASLYRISKEHWNPWVTLKQTAPALCDKWDSYSKKCPGLFLIEDRFSPCVYVHVTCGCFGLLLTCSFTSSSPLFFSSLFLPQVQTKLFVLYEDCCVVNMPILMRAITQRNWVWSITLNSPTEMLNVSQSDRYRHKLSPYDDMTHSSFIIFQLLIKGDAATTSAFTSCAPMTNFSWCGKNIFL